VKIVLAASAILRLRADLGGAPLVARRLQGSVLGDPTWCRQPMATKTTGRRALSHIHSLVTG
jgi:hypothetical protein